MKLLVFAFFFLISFSSICQERTYTTAKLDSLSTNSESRASKITVELKGSELSTYPVYRGCDKTQSNEDLKKCSIEKIKTFIKMSFDYEMADRVLPLEKSTKFQVNFIINTKGKVEKVNAQANHRAIAIEAIRIVKRLPKFKAPGKVNGKPVDTPFSLLMTVYFP